MGSNKIVLKAKNSSDIIDLLVNVTEGKITKAVVDLHHFAENDQLGLNILMKCKTLSRKKKYDIKFHFLNGTLAALKAHLREKKCTETKQYQ